ncbi:thiamine pyrophosphate-binding protein [Sphingomonas sp. ID1715]|uniref:thiamine pyrophosphate-binding protein n=1 Tax=Sphingomonas sp. ID1715 TaxID=1656898 RepID=UPI001488F36A|nr:thiamine pyrophosphate-binding protein [Sphingomonas sp. ID1715]NNM75545.1 thiamine pyrophosphate-binding protein [Sphingomonas sp. ID1715]
MTAKRTGGRILVDNLVAQGTDRIFTVPGESFLAVLDALHDTPSIEVVVCRQEGGVGFMACADGKLTGRPGIAFVTRGPGATNASIGVHVAMQDSLPMILFVGDVARGDRDREAFQEVDFGQMFGPLCKKVLRIDRAERIPEYTARAYATAMSGRPGPVVVVLPEDMLLEEVEAVDRPQLGRPLQVPCPQEIARIGEALRAAERPIAIIGGADWSQAATDAFAGFAEAWDLPVATAFRRQDCFPSTSPVFAGNLGYGPNPKLLERIRRADLLLVVGARLGEATTDGYTLIRPDHSGQKLIHIHPDPEELNSVYQADQALCVDMTIGLALQTLEAPAVQSRKGGEAHAEWLDWSTPKPRESARLDLGQCVLAMREAMPADTIICNGAGNFSGWWHRYWRYEGYGTQLAPTAGAMGYGVPTAVAACLRRPEQKVVAVAGDGDFLMNGQELATAVAYGCDMLVIVVDNGWYGTIRMHQEREYPGRVSGTQLHNPDFAALARAYGGWAETVEETDRFAPALARALDKKGVKLLHLKTDVEQLTPAITLSQLQRK